MSGRSLIQIIRDLANMPAETLDSITLEKISIYKEVRENIENYSLHEKRTAITLLDKAINDIAAERKEGKSNYIFFMLIKLRKLIDRSINSKSNVIALSKNAAYDFMSNQRVLSVQGIPSTAEEYLYIAKQSKYFDGNRYTTIETLLKIPVLFSMNVGAYYSWEINNQQFNLSTGHCIFGFSQDEDKRDSLSISINGGLLLNDYLIYKHTQVFRSQYSERIKNVYINLDTVYYAHKLKQTFPDLDEQNRFALVNRIISNQLEAISDLLPGGIICKEDDPAFQKYYEKIIYEMGLLDFVINNVRFFRGVNLSDHKHLALSLAYVAATYLYSPLVLQSPCISVESSLNVEVPSLIVLPFLESKEKSNLFSFIGLLPLPDLKMLNGSMTYGDISNGKIFLNDEATVVIQKARDFYRNWDSPYRCWYTAYFLAKQNSLPDIVCSKERCEFHSALIINDLSNLYWK